MTWKHLGKESAYEHSFLDHQLAKTKGIAGFRPKDQQFAINKQALDMLANLPSYDQEKVLKEIRYIVAHPNNTSSLKHKRFPWRRIFRSQTPFRNYHYLIHYSVMEQIKGKHNQIVIQEIFFDFDAVGSKPKSSQERTLLYHVAQKPNGTQFDGVKTKAEIAAFEQQWEVPDPVIKPTTTHVTVNGMLNELNKAAWLMGVHTQVAYQGDNVTEYTLFHNPSDGALLDLIECTYDKTFKTSHNARQLASIIEQQANKPTKWTVHSQGAIIFNSALSYFRKKIGSALNQHELVIHGSGANLKRLTKDASALGIKINQVRNNPFDLVPNVAGANDISFGSLSRSAAFCKLVTGNEVGASPHTLPYLGIETYHDQLVELGFHKEAKSVRRYINKNCK